MSNAGSTIACCEYLEVQWSNSVTNYYGVSALHTIPPFANIGHIIEPRIIASKRTDPFHDLELNPDLRTENVTVTFDDIDKAMTTLFKTYSSGVSCIVHLYYPDVDLDVEVWWGQLQAPTIYGWKTLKTTISNGYRSRELLIPGRSMRKECTAQIFGGKLPTVEAVRTSLCPYDKHLGGVVGVNDPVTTVPYLDCPKTIEACEARFGTSKYFGGFLTDSTAESSPNQGNPYLALSHSNASNFTDPIRVIFGFKYVKSSLVLQWKPLTPPGYEDGWVTAIFAVGEGPVENIINFRFNGQLTGANYINIRKGARGQAPVYYGTDVTVSNFSSTAHVLAQLSEVDTANISGSGDLTGECQVVGFNQVGVYNSSGVKVNNAYSEDRVWCLLELYMNQKFGMGYAEAEFNLPNWWLASNWLATVVTFVATYPDGETLTLSSKRSTFNAIVDGRPVAEVVEDICRGGSISVPFQDAGKFNIAQFRKATSGELSAARVFYDTGDAPNIIRERGQPPMIEVSQTPENKVVNEVELRFEDSANLDIERPIVVDDPDQKLKAGRQLGPDYFLSVPKKFSGFGITSLQEGVRHAYRLLKFGQFDEGGTDNNLQLKITVPFEQALGITRYEIIKVESDLLDNFDLPSGIVTDTARYPVEYFRVLRMKKVSGGRCEITAQVYNHTAYTNFESDGDAGGGAGNNFCTVRSAGSSVVRGVYTKQGVENGKPVYMMGNYKLAWNGSLWRFTRRVAIFTLVYYTSSNNVAYPWLVTTWTAVDGVTPLPEVYEGIPPSRPVANLTLGTPTHSATLQQITIPIP